MLLAFDEPENASYLVRGLTFEGYRVTHASTRAAALGVAREQPPDLVILDLGLPDIDGLELSRRLRADDPVAILMLTARDSIADRVAGLEGGPTTTSPSHSLMRSCSYAFTCSYAERPPGRNTSSCASARL